MTSPKPLAAEPIIARLLAMKELRHSALSLALVLLHLSPDPLAWFETYYDDLAVWLDGSRNTVGRRLHELERAGLVELERVPTADGKRHGPKTPYRIRFTDGGAADPSWRWRDLPAAIATVLPLLADAQLGPNVAAAYLRAAAAADEQGQLLIGRTLLDAVLGFSIDAAERHLRQLARFGLLELAETRRSPRQLKLAFASALTPDPEMERRRAARICVAHEATKERRAKSWWTKLVHDCPLLAAELASLPEWSTVERGATADELRETLAAIAKPLLPSSHRELLEQIVVRTAEEQHRSLSPRQLRHGFVDPVAAAIRTYGPALTETCLVRILTTKKMPNGFKRYYETTCANELEKQLERRSRSRHNSRVLVR